MTGVCSAKNTALVESLGADEVIDYQSTDFTKMDRKYDFVYDTIGKSSFSKCKRVLEPTGVYLSPVLNMPLLFQVLWTSFTGGKKAKFAATGMLPEDKLRAMLEELKPLIESGQLKSVIDRFYPLTQAVEAHQYVDTGRKKGNIVLVNE